MPRQISACPSRKRKPWAPRPLPESILFIKENLENLRDTQTHRLAGKAADGVIFGSSKCPTLR
jgi:hypothetical protein